MHMIANCVNFISPVHSCSRLSFLLHLKPSGDMKPEAMRQDHSCTLRVNHEGHVTITVALSLKNWSIKLTPCSTVQSIFIYFIFYVSFFFWWKKSKYTQEKMAMAKDALAESPRTTFSLLHSQLQLNYKMSFLTVRRKKHSRSRRR